MEDASAFFVLDGPLGPAPSPRQTKAAHLQGFAAILIENGRDPAAILERHAIDPKVLRTPDGFVDCRSLVETLEYCGRTLNTRLFGLDLAKRQPHLFGFLGSLCRAASDFRTAIESLCEFLPVLHSPECRLALETGHNVSELHFDSCSEFESLEQMTYGAIFTLLGLCRALGGREFRPAYISLTYDPPADCIDRLECEFACKVHVRQARNAIGFMNQVLGLPLTSGDRTAFGLLHGYAERVRSQSRLSLIVRVEDYIRGSLADQCNLRDCAATLAMSPRALQVRLDEYGVSFSDLLLQKRMELAQSYLSSRTLTLDAVALKLGYAEQTSFGRAFRRWTGSTPSAFRSAQAKRTN